MQYVDEMFAFWFVGCCIISNLTTIGPSYITNIMLLSLVFIIINSGMKIMGYQENKTLKIAESWCKHVYLYRFAFLIFYRSTFELIELDDSLEGRANFIPHYQCYLWFKYIFWPIYTYVFAIKSFLE